MEFTAEMIADFLGGEVVGNPAAQVNTFTKIEEGVPGALAFLSNPKYEPFVYQTLASVVIVAKTFSPTEAIKTTLIKVEDPYGCFAKLLELYAATKPRKTGISPLAAIHPSAQIEEGAYVGEFAVIGENVRIGKEAQIYPQVYIGDQVKIGEQVSLYPGVKIYEKCVLGARVTIHAGAIIGGDGFGFAPDEKGVFHKIPQLGNVVIADDVEIGANTCIDRATMGSTCIGQGTKLDNLIQIGHNAVIGTHTVAAAQFGLAGSSKVGNSCMIGGQVGIVGHINIGNQVKIASGAGISNNIADGETFMGAPAMPVSKHHRVNAVFRNLPGLSAKVHQLSKEVKHLQEQMEEK